MPQSDTEAVAWFRKGALQGLANAQSALGVMYGEGRGVPQSDTEAAAWLRKAADQGLSVAELALGVRYQEGRGVPQSDAEAIGWFRKSAARGYVNAQFMLAGMYGSGRGVPKDDTEVARWLRMAAQQGSAAAQCTLGLMYQEGRGVLRSDSEAAIWFHKAAKQEDAFLGLSANLLPTEEQVAHWQASAHVIRTAQYNLGLMYYHGRGVPQSAGEAAVWFGKSADRGHVPAQNELGAMYFHGGGVQQSDAVAVAWFRKAAAQGNAQAQYNLGWMYANGRGVTQDGNQARHWFRKAAEQNHEEAKQSLKNPAPPARRVAAMPEAEHPAPPAAAQSALTSPPPEKLKARQFFCYDNGAGKMVVGDPLALLHGLRLESLARGTTLDRLIAEHNKVDDPATAPEEDVACACRAAFMLADIVHKVFGLAPFDPETGNGADMSHALGCLHSFNVWMEKKNQTPDSRPTSTPPSES